MWLAASSPRVLNRRITPGQQIITGLEPDTAGGTGDAVPVGEFCAGAGHGADSDADLHRRHHHCSPRCHLSGHGPVPRNAGTSASAGSTIIFICGGLISALISLSPANLQSTLGYSFVLLSGVALMLNNRSASAPESEARPAPLAAISLPVVMPHTPSALEQCFAPFPPDASGVESADSSPFIPRRVYELRLRPAAIPQRHRQLPDTRPFLSVPDVNRSSLPFST
jgi:hypothetical protein